MAGRLPRLTPSTLTVKGQEFWPWSQPPGSEAQISFRPPVGPRPVFSSVQWAHKALAARLTVRTVEQGREACSVPPDTEGAFSQRSQATGCQAPLGPLCNFTVKEQSQVCLQEPLDGSSPNLQLLSTMEGGRARHRAGSPVLWLGRVGRGGWQDHWAQS